MNELERIKPFKTENTFKNIFYSSDSGLLLSLIKPDDVSCESLTSNFDDSSYNN